MEFQNALIRIGSAILCVIWMAVLVGNLDEPAREGYDGAASVRFIPRDLGAEIAGVDLGANRSIADPAIYFEDLIFLWGSKSSNSLTLTRRDNTPASGLIRSLETFGTIGTNLDNSSRGASLVLELNGYRLVASFAQFTNVTRLGVNDGALRFVESVKIMASNLSLPSCFTESRVNQAQAENAHTHSDERGHPHGLRPSGHGALGFQIILIALIWSCFAFSLFRAIRLGEFRDPTFGPYTYACGVGLIGGVFVSLDLGSRFLG